MHLKIIADENIPLKVIQKLHESQIDVLSITENNRGISDKEIAGLAIEENGYILTFDKDFGDIIYKDKFKLKGMILLRIEPRNIDYIFNKIIRVIDIIKDNDDYNIFVVTEDKIRIRKF